MTARTYLALGDSYTIGEGVPPAGRWPVQLVARLRAAGMDMADPRIIATTGWTTDELASAMDVAHLTPGYGLVTLLIGVNNQYRGRAAAEYRAEFSALLRRSITLAGDARRVVVVSIPDWGVTRFATGRDRAAIASATDAFNGIARDETLRAFSRWVDVTGISRHDGDAADTLVDDGLHPSAKQYSQWAEAIFPEAHAALKELPALL